MKADQILTEDKRQAVCAWLSTNDIDPSSVPMDADLRVATEEDGIRAIHYTRFVLTEGGQTQMDPNDSSEVWQEERTAPCVVEPADSLGIPEGGA